MDIPEGSEEGTFAIVQSPFEAPTEGVYEVIIDLNKGADHFEYPYKFSISTDLPIELE